MAAHKILLIDGDPASRKYLAAVLEKAGYAVEVATSGDDGLQVFDREKPDLILVDPVLNDVPGDQLAARLHADPRAGRIPLVALSSDPSPARMKSCMQAGYSDYLVKSSEAIPTLLDSLARLLPHARPAVADGGTLIAFISAKGGTGTSTLCANIAMNMADNRPTANIAVADLVLPLGSLAGVVGYKGAMNLVRLASLTPEETTPDFLRHQLPKLDGWKFHLLAGCPDPGSGNKVDPGRVGEIVTALQQAYDFVVLDLGRALSRISIPLIERADLVAMIVGADPAAADLSKSVWEYLRNLGISRPDVYVIMNRSAGPHGLKKDDAEKIIGLSFNAAVPHQADNFSLAASYNQAYSNRFPADTTSIVFREMAIAIMNRVAQKRAV